MRKFSYIAFIFLLFFSCKKKDQTNPVAPGNLYILVARIDNVPFDASVYGTRLQPVVKITFTEPVKQSTITGAVVLSESGGGNASIITSLQNHDSVLVIQPASLLKGLTQYNFTISSSLQSAAGGSLAPAVSKTFVTGIDSSRKFPAISDDSLLTLVQKQTFKYFWDFGHPVSGLARERNSSGDIVTTGGSGFGIMTIPVAINRGFITRADGLARMQKITGFLTNTAVRFHGAFSHWMNGSTGTVVPFGTNDNGADLVETSYMMMGLLTARQYFDGSDVAETNLRTSINNLWNGVEWDWFRQNGKKVLYWNWSPDYGWAVNVPVQGWNECLITYVLAASSTTHGIPKPVYDSGYARNGAMMNNNTYYGYQLPLGQAYGGPLFFEHYSFMGIKPVGLNDVYANYAQQTQNHTLINYSYCVANPLSKFGYSDSCWGLTASDIQSGYTASSPTNDVGVIAPTAAISSLPYTPTQSLKALKFFYYVLGDKLWGDYGFYDAFNLSTPWFASSTLAIDQAPEIVMIENYRTGLLWNLFTSCPEVKAGMQTLGFTAPYL